MTRQGIASGLSDVTIWKRPAFDRQLPPCPVALLTLPYPRSEVKIMIIQAFSIPEGYDIGDPEEERCGWLESLKCEDKKSCLAAGRASTFRW
jgi:hypothetical protein